MAMPDRNAFAAFREAAGRRNDPDYRIIEEILFSHPSEDSAANANLLLEQFDFEMRIAGREPHPFMPSPTSEEIGGGSIPVGTLLNYEEEVATISPNGHIYIAGGIQLGKTTLAKTLILNAYAAGRQCIVFDPLGRFVDLAGEIREGDCWIVSPELFQVNPFAPPDGMDVIEWFDPLMNIEREISRAGKNIEALYMSAAMAVLASGQQLSLPSFRDEIRKREPKRYGPDLDAWQRLMNTVNGIMTAMPYLCVESSRGLGEILSRPLVIFDLSTLTNNVRKKYLVLLTLAHLLHSRPMGGAWTTLVAVDEVHHLASTELARKLEDGEPYFNVTIRTAGNIGCAFLTIDQNPAFTHPVVRANSSTKILFRLEGGEDKRVIGQDLSLTPEQIAFLSQLKQREAIVKLPGVTPFIVRVPEVEYVDPSNTRRVARGA